MSPAENTSIDNSLLSIETDPLEKTYGLRIPLKTHLEIENLSKVQKKQLAEKLLIKLDEELHRMSWIPGTHLKTTEG